MLPLLVATLCVAAAPGYPKEAPAILIYWVPGYTFPSPGWHLDVAIWDDGTAIWREPFAKWEPDRQRHWSLSKGSYFRATLKQNDVRAAMEQLEKQKILGEKFESYIVVDGNYTEEDLRYRGKFTTLAMNGVLGGRVAASNAVKSKKSTDAWLSIFHSVKLLLPSKGTPTVEPPDSAWMNWRRPENDGRKD